MANGNLPIRKGTIQQEGRAGVIGFSGLQMRRGSHPISGDSHALDDYNYSVYSLDPWTGKQLHLRRVDPYPSGARDHCFDLQPAQRPKSSIATAALVLAPSMARFDGPFHLRISTSVAINPKNTTEITPFSVKNAAFIRLISFGETIMCS